MFYISVSAAIFILTVVLHIVLSNINSSFLSNRRNTIATYILGFFINVSLIIFLWNKIRFYDGTDNLWFLPISGVAIIVYLLLTIAYLIFFLSPFLGEESPTSRIIIIIKNKREISGKDLISHFSNENLIKKRLVKMVEINWIKNTNYGYVILSKGKIIANIIKFYRKILGAELFG